jgi:hypothetical protein
MSSVKRAIEQLRRISIDACGIDLDAAEKFVPLIERGLTDSIEIEVRNFRLGVRTRLVLGDERYPYSCKDRRSACRREKIDITVQAKIQLDRRKDTYLSWI